MLLELLQDRVADRAVHHGAHMGDRAEDEGQGRHVGRRDQVVERRHVDAVQVDHAEAGLLDRVLLVAELGRVEDVDLDAALGALFEQLADVACTASIVG